MFGLTENEIREYRDAAQDFAIREAAPSVVANSKFVLPAYVQGDKTVADMNYYNQIVTDLETIITLTAVNMAYDYAHLQCESTQPEIDIVAKLHAKYETYVIDQMIKYGLTFTADGVTEIIGVLLLEMPYLYIGVIEDEDFDDDQFLEDRLEAYDSYINDNFSGTYDDDYDEDEEYEEDEEDVDE